MPCHGDDMPTNHIFWHGNMLFWLQWYRMPIHSSPGTAISTVRLSPATPAARALPVHSKEKGNWESSKLSARSGCLRQMSFFPIFWLDVVKYCLQTLKTENTFCIVSIENHADLSSWKGVKKNPTALQLVQCISWQEGHGNGCFIAHSHLTFLMALSQDHWHSSWLPAFK